MYQDARKEIFVHMVMPSLTLKVLEIGCAIKGISNLKTSNGNSECIFINFNGDHTDTAYIQNNQNATPMQ